MRREPAFLADIVSAADDLAAFCKGHNKESFLQDPIRWRAVLHALTIIGEAASRLPDEFRRKHPEGAWADASGLRNRIVHEYWNLDWEVLWTTVTRDVPVLRAVAAAILEREFPEGPV